MVAPLLKQMEGTEECKEEVMTGECQWAREAAQGGCFLIGLNA